MEHFLNAFALALTPMSIAAIGLGSLVGLIFGSIPGLTFTVALALALPISFNLDAVPAIGLLLGTYIGGMTGGSVSAILLGIPGTPSAAATVLDQAHQNGFKGVMIGTQPKGKGGVLDDPELIPFWESAHRNGSVLFIHPVFDSGDDRVNDYGMNNAIGRITDTLIAISRIIYSGHVETYHNAKIVIGIGGSALPYVLGRMMRNYNLHKDTLADPSKALSMLYYDTLLHDPDALAFLIRAVGIDRIMLGSDMPFPIGDPSPLAVLDGLDMADRNKLVNGVASQLFGL